MNQQISYSISGHPIVKATLLQGGQQVEGYFLIDTASTQNIIRDDLSFTINNCNVRRDINVYSLGKRTQNGSLTDVRFRIKGQFFEEQFCQISIHQMNKTFREVSLLGILGIEFFTTHHLILDFSKNRLYDAPPFLSKEYIPLSFTDNLYGIPAIQHWDDKGDIDILSIVDTGSNLSLLNLDFYKGPRFAFSPSTLRVKQICHVMTEVTTAETSFLIPLKVSFYVDQSLDRLDMTVKGKRVSAILGVDFMRINKLVIDFSSRKIYVDITF